MRNVYIIFLLLITALCFTVGCGEMSQEQLDQELIKAWDEENYDRAKQMLEDGASPGVQVSSGGRAGYPIIVAAAAEGQHEFIELLINYGADVNAIDRDGMTALHRAENTTLAKMLIDHGANVDRVDNRGRTLMHRAAVDDDFEMARFLIEQGANAQISDNNNDTALHLTDNRDIAVLLVEAGANVLVQNRKEQVPLHLSAKRGNPEISAILLEEGTGINAMCKLGWAPLHYAASEGDVEMTYYLLSMGAGINSCSITIPAGTPLVQTPDGWQPDLDFIVFGPTALNVAIDKGHTEVAELLVKYGGVEDPRVLF